MKNSTLKYYFKNFFSVSAETCKESNPYCTETGGSCKSYSEDDIRCECWGNITYKENIGCEG